MLPDEITAKLDAQRDERKVHMSRIYAISAQYAPVMDPAEMYPAHDDWQPSPVVDTLESRCIYRDDTTHIHLVRSRENGVIREHRHREGQYVQVLQGLMRVRRGSDIMVLRRGDWTWIEPQMPHRMTWSAGTEHLLSFTETKGC